CQLRTEFASTASGVAACGLNSSCRHHSCEYTHADQCSAQALTPSAGSSVKSPPFQRGSAASASIALCSRTRPCGYVFAVPHRATIASTSSEGLVAQWNACCAPIENPMTARTWRTPRPSRSTRLDASTSSRIATRGNRGPSNGAGVLLGDEDPPLPNISVATTK